MCDKCKYASCNIYDDTQRDLDMFFEAHATTWHKDYYENPNVYGVEPLFEPLDVHANGNEHLVEELKKQGIHINNCQFLHPTKGCMIPFEKRLSRCQKEIIVCEKIYRALNNELLTFTDRIKTKRSDNVLFTFCEKGRSTFIDASILFPNANSNRKEVLVTIYYEHLHETETLKQEVKRIQTHIENELKNIPSLRVKLAIYGINTTIGPVEKLYPYR